MKWGVVDGRVVVAVKLLLILDPIAEMLPVLIIVDCLGAVVMVIKEETAEETVLAPELLIIVILGRVEDETVAVEVIAMVVTAVTELAIAVDITAFGP